MIEIFTTQELAEMLKIDAMTVRRMAASGEISAFRVQLGKAKSEYRFTRENVDGYIEAHRVVKQEVQV